MGDDLWICKKRAREDYYGAIETYYEPVSRADQPTDERMAEALKEFNKRFPDCFSEPMNSTDRAKRMFRDTIRAALRTAPLTQQPGNVTKSDESLYSEKDRVIMELADALRYYSDEEIYSSLRSRVSKPPLPSGEYTFTVNKVIQCDLGNLSRSVLTKPENAAVIEGAKQ